MPRREAHTLRERLEVARAASVALLADPGDLKQVFLIIEALSFGADSRVVRRLRRTQAGAELLAERPSLVSLLRDRDALRRLPSGSLGREYLRFVEAENITADGIVSASHAGAGPTPPATADDLFMRERMRDAHDLWHVVTGYGGDLLGEAGLLAFTFAQTRHPGVGLIVLLGLLFGPPALRRKRFLLQSWLRGARAGWMVPERWEELLPLPLDEVRARLGLDEPPSYARVDLRHPG